MGLTSSSEKRYSEYPASKGPRCKNQCAKLLLSSSYNSSFLCALEVRDRRDLAEHVRLLRRRMLLRDPQPADQTRRGLGGTHPWGRALRGMLPLSTHPSRQQASNCCCCLAYQKAVWWDFFKARTEAVSVSAHSQLLVFFSATVACPHHLFALLSCFMTIFGTSSWYFLYQNSKPNNNLLCISSLISSSQTFDPNSAA